MAVDLESTFFIHKVIMHILGFWVSKDYSIVYKIYSHFLYIFFTVTSPILPMIYLALADDVNMFDAAQSLFMAIEVFALIFKIYSITSNIEGVEESYSVLKSEIFNSQYPEQDYILRNSKRIAKRNTYIFLSFCYGSSFGWGLLPIFTGSGKLPTDIWLPFEVPETKVNHAIMYIYLFIGKVCFFYVKQYTFLWLLGVVYAAHAHAILDTLSSGLIVLATGQVRVLKDTLFHLQKYTDDVLNLEVVPKQDLEKRRAELMLERIKKCVKHHQAIVK